MLVDLMKASSLPNGICILASLHWMHGKIYEASFDSLKSSLFDFTEKSNIKIINNQ
jgi:hypothetical protein